MDSWTLDYTTVGSEHLYRWIGVTIHLDILRVVDYKQNN